MILPSAEADLEKLSDEVRAAILRRLEWLRVNAEVVIHRRLHNLPEELAGLCRLRYSDYRILYWRLSENCSSTSEDYKILRSGTATNPTYG